MVLPLLVVAAGAVAVGAIVASASNTRKAPATPLGVHPVCVVIRSHHGKYITVAQDGKIKADAASAGASETFLVVPLGEKKYALRAANGKFVTLQGNASLAATADKLGNTEAFDVAWEKHDTFALKGCYKSWLCAEKSGNVICNRSKVDEWERFSFFLAGSGVPLTCYYGYYHNIYDAKNPKKENPVMPASIVSLRSLLTSRFVCAEGGDQMGTLTCTREAVREWEMFQLLPVLFEGHIFFGLKTHQGKWAALAQNGSIVSVPDLSYWCLFDLVKLHQDKCVFALRCIADGRYMGAFPQGQFVSGADSINFPQQFVVQVIQPLPAFAAPISLAAPAPVASSPSAPPAVAAMPPQAMASPVSPSSARSPQQPQPQQQQQQQQYPPQAMPTVYYPSGQAPQSPQAPILPPQQQQQQQIPPQQQAQFYPSVPMPAPEDFAAYFQYAPQNAGQQQPPQQ